MTRCALQRRLGLEQIRLLTILWLLACARLTCAEDSIGLAVGNFTAIQVPSPVSISIFPTVNAPLNLIPLSPSYMSDSTQYFSLANNFSIHEMKRENILKKRAEPTFCRAINI